MGLRGIVNVKMLSNISLKHSVLLNHGNKTELWRAFPICLSLGLTFVQFRHEFESFFNRDCFGLLQVKIHNISQIQKTNACSNRTLVPGQESRRKKIKRESMSVMRDSRGQRNQQTMSSAVLSVRHRMQLYLYKGPSTSQSLLSENVKVRRENRLQAEEEELFKSDKKASKKA